MDPLWQNFLDPRMDFVWFRKELFLYGIAILHTNLREICQVFIGYKPVIGEFAGSNLDSGRRSCSIIGRKNTSTAYRLK